MKQQKKSINTRVPEMFRPLLWSGDFDKLSLERDKVYIVHQVLALGSLKDIKKLFTLYSKEEIRNIFVHFPKRVYIGAVFYLIKNFLLKLQKISLPPEKYVKTLFGNHQRAAAPSA